MLNKVKSRLSGKTVKTILVILTVVNLSIFAQGITIGSGTTFTASSATITLSNNWSNSGTFTAGSGTVIFNGASGNQTITNTSGETFNNLTVNKAADDVQLINNISINTTLTVTSGDLDINSQSVSVDPSATISESAGSTCKNGTLSATITDLGSPTSNNVCGLGAELTSTTDMDETTVARGHTVQTITSNTGIERYYDITPATNSGLSATFVFHYDDSELNSVTESELGLFKSTDGGSNWTSEGGSIDVNNNTVTLSE